MGISVAMLAGCSGSAGTTGTAGTTGKTGTASTTGTAGTASTTPASSQDIAAAGNTTRSASSGAAWTLSAPGSVFGFARIQPQQVSLAKIRSELATTAAELGVSGSEVISVYDDPTHDVYVIFAGYNGSGFDPDKMKAVFDVAPLYTTDGTGDHLVENHVMIDAGAHGGLAGCATDAVQSGGLAGEATACVWLTRTTMGILTYYPKPDLKQMVFGTGPEVLGPVMRQLRDQVEHRS
jgi:hypothetical protein